MNDTEIDDSRRTFWISLGLLAVLLGSVALLYARVADFPFLDWDDPIYVRTRSPLQEIAIGHLDGFWKLLSPTAAHSGEFWEYFPVRDFTYGCDVWRGGLSPGPMHVTNLIIHLLCVLLVFALGWCLGLGPLPSLGAAAVFGLHPLAVEPVAWISGRKDPLYSLFVLLSLVGLHSALQAARGTWRHILGWAGFGLSTLAAFGTKGPGVIAVPLAFWLVFVHHRSLSSPEISTGESNAPPRTGWPWRTWLWLVPWVLLAAAWVGFTLWIASRNGIMVGREDGLLGSFFRALGAPFRALVSFLLPLNLSPAYGAYTTSWYTDPHSWAMVLLVALSASLWRRGKLEVSRPVLLAIGAALATLPTSGVVAVAQSRADRFLYLSLAFMSLLAADLARRVATRRRWLMIPLVGALGLSALLSHQYISVWKSDITLWQWVYSQDQDNATAHLNLGSIALRDGKMGPAKKFLDRAVRKNPNLYEAWHNLGLWWYKHGILISDQAAAPKRVAALHTAQKLFQRSISIKKRNPEAYYNLALTRWRLGDHAQAELLLKKTLRIPSHMTAQAAAALGTLLWWQKRKQEAWRLVSQYQARFPASAHLRRWLASRKKP